MSFGGVVTCALVLNEQGRFWLMRRTDKCRDEHWKWDTCAGMLEYTYTARDNMLKELKEEIDVVPHSLEFLGYEDIFRGENDLDHLLRLNFCARVQAADVHIAEPHKFSEGGWFTMDSLPSPLHSQTRPWLEKYYG